jgi:FtsP/CotA-like multicopper oxidase with cupredoxin domain
MDFDDPQTNLVRFDIVPLTAPDRSSIPSKFRPWPQIDLGAVNRERVWTFDYQGGLWTINNEVMDPNRIDAGIDQGSAEIWTFRNGGRNWSHPIHSHFVEFLFLEINGRPYREDYIQDISGKDAEGRDLDLEPILDSVKQVLDAIPGSKPAPDPKLLLGKTKGTRSPVVGVGSFMGGRRRDVAILLPSDEMKIYMRWPDFLGKYVMHCHNVVHEDHAMMIRWDIVEPGKGFDTPRFDEGTPPHVLIRPASPSMEEGPSGPPAPPEE